MSVYDTVWKGLGNSTSWFPAMTLYAEQSEHHISDTTNERASHLLWVGQRHQPVHGHLKLFYGAPTTKVAGMDQDITLRQRKRLRVGVRDTHKSRPALTRVWRDTIPVRIVHNDGRYIAVSRIRGLDESVFVGTRGRHGSVGLPQVTGGRGY